MGWNYYKSRLLSLSQSAMEQLLQNATGIQQIRMIIIN